MEKISGGTRTKNSGSNQKQTAMNDIDMLRDFAKGLWGVTKIGGEEVIFKKGEGSYSYSTLSLNVGKSDGRDGDPISKITIIANDPDLSSARGFKIDFQGRMNMMLLPDKANSTFNNPKDAYKYATGLAKKINSFYRSLK